MYVTKIGKILDLFRSKARWSQYLASWTANGESWVPAFAWASLFIDLFVGGGGGTLTPKSCYGGGSGHFIFSSACINNGCDLWANLMVGGVEIALRWYQGGRKASPALDGTCIPSRRKSKYSLSRFMLQDLEYSPGITGPPSEKIPPPGMERTLNK